MKDHSDGNNMSKPRVVELSLNMLEARFKLPLNKAAQSLGLSLTALKWYENLPVILEIVKILLTHISFQCLQENGNQEVAVS